MAGAGTEDLGLGACRGMEYCGWEEANRSGPAMSIAARICSGVHSLNPM